MNFHPVGYKTGKKLRRYVLHNGRKLQLVIRHRDDYKALDENGTVVLNFIDKNSNNVSTDEDGMFVDLNAFRSDREKENLLNANFRKINQEVQDMIDMLLGRSQHKDI